MPILKVIFIDNYNGLKNIIAYAEAFRVIIWAIVILWTFKGPVLSTHLHRKVMEVGDKD